VKLPPAALATAMGQFYRGEVGSSNTWRCRLDTTSNWGVLLTGATLSFTFSDATHPHFVIPINSLLVLVFLFIEARRYRYYEICSSRARVIEMDYFAPMLSSQTIGDKDWAAHLSDDLSTPDFTISMWEALGRRLRRNYIPLLIMLAACWILKVYLQPEPAHDFNEFITRSSIGIIPGWIVFIVGTIFNGAVATLALATIGLRQAKGTRVK
jgi:uncharacterized membrane protein